MQLRCQPRRPAALLAGLLALLACEPGGPRFPNVLLVCVDTLRFDALGASGGPLPTPAFDRLVAEGVWLRAAIAPAAETAPSHAALFTGRSDLHHGVARNGASLAADLPTLAEAFRAAGYHTAAFVSSFVLDPRFGWGRGFDRYDASFREGSATLAKERAYPGAFWREHAFGGFDRRAGETTDAALAWLPSAPEPFFLFVHFFDPHMPYVPPPAFARQTAGLAVDLTGREVPGVPGAALEDLVRRYQAEVLYSDAQLGRLLEALKAGGRGERSLVVVTADHGEALGQHGWIEHGVNLHEELVRVPLVFHWPGRLPAGRRLETPVGLVDLAATLAELAGVAFEAGGESLSAAAALRSGSEPAARPLLGHARAYASLPGPAGAEKRSVRTGRWKYLRTAGAPEALYDLRADPAELRDVAALHPEVVQELARVLDAQLAAAAPQPAGEALPEEVRRGLEALGYAE